MTSPPVNVSVLWEAFNTIGIRTAGDHRIAFIQPDNISKAPDRKIWGFFVMYCPSVYYVIS